MPLVKPPQDYIVVDAALPAAVSFGPAERARLVKQSVEICEKKGVLGSGYIPKLHWTEARANSEGLFAYYRYAEASFILTCRTPDGTGSGWAGTTGMKDVTQIDAAGITEIAASKALKSRNPRALEPGNYTVILEPRPAARFLSLMLVRAQRARGRGRAQLHERHRTRRHEDRPEDLRRQRHHPQRRRQRTAAPDADRPGRSRRPAMTWVEKGVVKNLFYDRYWAKKQNKPFTPTGPQQSLAMDGGDATSSR